MKSYNIRMILLALSCRVSTNDGLAIPIMKTAENVMAVLGLAFDTHSLITDIIGDSSSAYDEEFEKRFESLENRIDSAKDEINSKSQLLLNLDRLYDIYSTLGSSMKDLKNALKAKNGTDELINLFVVRYDNHEVVKKSRELETLLTTIIPGQKTSMVSLFIHETRCNGTSFKRFREFYLDLIAEATLLEITYLEYKTHSVDITTFKEEWVSVTLKVDAEFEKQVVLCNNRFPEDIQADLETTSDPEMKNLLLTRYPDRVIDFVAYSGIATKQYHIQREPTTPNYVFKSKAINHFNKFLVVNDFKGRQGWKKQHATRVLRECISRSVLDEEDENAAETVLNVLLYCNGLEIPIGVAIIYFEGDDFFTNELDIHSNSSVILLSYENVELAKVDSTGRFRIIVYPDPNGSWSFFTSGCLTTSRCFNNLVSVFQVLFVFVSLRYILL